MDAKKKEKIKAIVAAAKKRKQTAGKVNIENVSAPKKHKPKHVKENHKKAPAPASVSIGAHGGRYVQEASGHKRYVKEGSLSGGKKLKKSLREEIAQVIAEDFVKSFKEKKNERK